MKTNSRKNLQYFAGLMLSVIMLIGMDTEVQATETTALMDMNAGAAEVLDSVDFRTTEEMAEITTSEDEETAKTEIATLNEKEDAKIEIAALNGKETAKTEIAALNGKEAAKTEIAALNGKEAAKTEIAALNEEEAAKTEIAASNEKEAAKTEIAASNEEEETKEYTLVMADVKESMNVRQEPSTDSAKVGLLYADCGGIILERADGWTKIQSGNLVGWANDDYLIFGEEAEKLAEEVGIYKATVHASGLRIRKEATTDSGVWGVVEDGDIYEALSEYTTDEWVAIEYGGALGYISAEYVTMEFTIDHGETFEEIKERELRERKEQQKLIIQEGTSVIGTTDDRLLAALIQCEAANQPYEGQVAVGAVVMNRVNSAAYPNSIAGVIYASGQFTPAVTGKVEKLAVEGVKDSCLQAAQAAMNGESPIGGAMHFRRAGKHEGQVIGDHVFW